jgi:signal transduction histidine kinase
VIDNGIGFDAQSVQKDEHFGLGILQERIAKLNGQVMMDSSANSGTVVSISVPVCDSLFVRR